MKYLSVLIIVCFLLISCDKSSADVKFADNSNAEASEFFRTTVLPILESKCNSCHNYHNSTSTAYKTYNKTVGALDDIISRTHSIVGSVVMPPLNEPSLTSTELESFLELKDMLKTDTKDLEVDLKWTAYKFPGLSTRAGVSGSFSNYNWNLKNTSDSVLTILKGAELSIFTNSVNVGGDSLKNSNLSNHFFAYMSSVIYCEVISIDSTQALISIEMNHIKNDVLFDVTFSNNELSIDGVLNDLNFYDSSSAQLELDKVCGVAHQGILWPDVALHLTILNYDKLND
tara:strand:- start:99 stop:956 length:858 start_codon:yes stop_codon:yes gene_type:complete